MCDGRVAMARRELQGLLDEAGVAAGQGSRWAASMTSDQLRTIVRVVDAEQRMRAAAWAQLERGQWP